MKTLSRGFLITIEGIDGCGKSTLIKNLVPHLTNLPFVITREPGGTPLGQHLRTIIQQDTLDPKTEFLLYAADRARHCTTIIKPALAQKKIVISDRLADSSVVYQGYVRGLDVNIIQTINGWALEPVQPDLTFFISIAPELAYERLSNRKKQLSAQEQQLWAEKEKLSFMQQAALGYQKLFEQRTNVITLDGTKTPDMIAQETAAHLHTFISKQESL